MTIRALVYSLSTVFAFLLAALAAVAALLYFNELRVVHRQEVRLTSYLLADELRQSSDDLTRAARAYVATGNPRYEEYYWRILDIRNGKQARPPHYERVYWDMVFGGAAAPAALAERRVPLEQLMREAGFTRAEFDKLHEAQAHSDALVRTEETAMHAMKGEFADDAGGFTRRGPPDQATAVRLMNDEAYYKAKAKIMGPINEFFDMLDKRTRTELEKAIAMSRLYMHAIFALLAVIGLTGCAALVVVRRRVVKPVAVLQQQTRTVASDLSRLAATTAEIARGDWRRVFTLETAPLGLRSRDEIGELARLHDAMLGRLQETGAAIAAVTAEAAERGFALRSAQKEIEKSNTQLTELARELESRVGQRTAELAKANAAAKEGEERFRSLFENANDAFLVLDGEKFIDCNSQALRLFGCGMKRDLVGVSPADFSPETQPDGRLSSAAAVEHIRAALSGKAQRFDWRHRRRDGTLFDAEVSLNAVEVRGRKYLQAIVREAAGRRGGSPS